VADQQAVQQQIRTVRVPVPKQSFGRVVENGPGSVRVSGARGEDIGRIVERGRGNVILRGPGARAEAGRVVERGPGRIRILQG